MPSETHDKSLSRCISDLGQQLAMAINTLQKVNANSISSASSGELSEAVQRLLSMQELQHDAAQYLQKLTESSLQNLASESLISSLDDIIIEINADGICLNIWCSDESKLFMPKAKALGNNLLEMLPEAISQPVRERIELAFHTGESQRFDYPDPFVKDPREAPWYRCKINYQKNTIGENRFSLMISDITELVRMRLLKEQRSLERKQAEEKLSLILDHSLTAAHECLIDENWTTLFMNAHIETISGYPPADFIDNKLRSYVSIIVPEDLARVQSSIQTAITKQTYFDITYRIRHKSGEIRWVWERGSISKEKGHLVGVIFDITDQRKTKDLLEQTSKEYSEFFSVALDLLCIADTNCMFRKLNPSWSRVLGYTHDELMAQSFLEFVHPEDIDATLREVDKLKSGIPTVRFENRYRCKDGSYRIFSWATTPDPSTGLLYAAAHDLTDVRIQETQFRQTLEALEKSAIVGSTDRYGKILSVNDNFCSISGYSREELIGQDHRIINSGRHSREFFASMWQTILAGRVWSGEIENRSKEGKLYTVQSVIAPLLNVEGHIERFLAIRFDVTQEKESGRLLEEAQRVARIGSWSFDLETHLIRWSKQMFELFPEDAAKGPPSYERHFATIHPDDRALWKSKVDSCIQSATPYKMRFRAIFPDGRVNWIEAFGEGKRNKYGAVTSISGTCQDITELVLAEDGIRQERAKAIHSAKLASLGEMSAGIAHEINNPLTIISGTIRLLPKIAQDSEDFRAKIESIEKATHRIAKIVGGLRKFSRTSGAIEKKICRVADIVHEAIVLTSSKTSRHSVRVDVKGEVDLKVLCDEIEIEQVIVNLINNAVDAIKLLPERWIQILITEEKAGILLQIKDSGSGIPLESRDKLFQPFFTTKAIGEGTGLGLAITKGILEDHQASIELNVKEPHTCFDIHFKQVKETKDVA